MPEKIPKAVSKIPKAFLRDLENWPSAPIPACMGGDLRSLTFCCKPGSSLTFGYKCNRDEILQEINMTGDEFIELKQEFSTEHDWDSPETCFGSLSYCCMRRGGCHRRDAALKRRYPDLSYEDALAEYYRLKRILANIILIKAGNKEKADKYIEK